MKPTKTILAFATGLVLAGCGSSDSRSSPATSTSSVRSPTTEATASAISLTPAPGEEWVAFRSPRPDGRDGIFLARPDGSDRHQLVADLPFVQASPAWSPDGSRLAFIERNPDEALWVVDADGSDAKELVPPSDGCCGQDKPDWSPDGTSIAFVRWIGPEDAITTEIMLYEIDTGATSVAYSSQFPVVLDRPRWSPGSRRTG